ncbi:DNA-directed RNA polymerase [Candidatus Pacearchaeota archaeon]|nr:DNA-directed RNA polymerase [Candidatus Pacearchaeota archaeon]
MREQDGNGRDFERRSSGFGNRGNGGPRRSFGPKDWHKAVCSECKKECEVPFKPTEGKPVYCKECFSKRRDR